MMRVHRALVSLRTLASSRSLRREEVALVLATSHQSRLGPATGLDPLAELRAHLVVGEAARVEDLQESRALERAASDCSSSSQDVVSRSMSINTRERERESKHDRDVRLKVNETMAANWLSFNGDCTLLRTQFSAWPRSARRRASPSAIEMHVPGG